MTRASDTYQPIELRDPQFLLEDSLTTVLATDDCEGSLEEVSVEFSKHLISPKHVSRLLIERGEYPAVPIRFRYPSIVTPDWSSWVSFEMQNKKHEEVFNSAGIKLALFISGFCNIYRDDICLRHVVRRWSPQTHTFVCSWGEFTPTLEDVCNIMRIPIFGGGNPFSIRLSEAQNKKLETLKKGAYSFKKEVFRFCNWLRHFWGFDKGGTFWQGEGFESGCRVEALLAYWLSKFIFTDFPHDQVQERVFPLAIMLAAGIRFPLAPFFLSHLYQRLDQIAKDEKDGAGQYGIDTLVSTFFLQVFVWERFKGLAVTPIEPEFLHQLNEEKKVFNLLGFPLCFRWFGKKAKKGAFKPVVMDEIEQFDFRPYFSDHGFLVFPFFNREEGSSPFIGATELLLTTTARSILACDDSFCPSIVKYSPHRVKRQFGIDQEVPLHLAYEGHAGDCIVAFTRTNLDSCWDKLSNSLGKKGSVGSPTLAFSKFWKQQRREFARFVKTSGTRLCPKSNHGNKRLLFSKSFVGVMLKLNLPYFEVYSDHSECLVGHLMDVKGGRNNCVAKGKVGLAKNGGKGKNVKVRRFKPKVAKDRIRHPTAKSVNDTMLTPSLKLAGGKRKATSILRPSGTVKKKVAPNVTDISLRRSPRVAVMTHSKVKPPADGDPTDNRDNESQKSEDSPLSDDGSTYENSASGSSEDEASNDNNQTESFEGEDSEDDEDHGNSSPTAIEGSSPRSSTILMEDNGHGVSKVSGTDAQVHDPVVNAGFCEDSRGEQSKSNELISLEIGGIMHGDNNPVDTALVNGDTPSTPIHSSGLETRFKNFVACFDAKGSFSTTLEDIAQPLSGNQSSFEGLMVPSELVVPLTKFAHRHGGGSFSSLFARGNSPFQKRVVAERFGLLLHSMEVEEVKNEMTFLIWRDVCCEVIGWGLQVDFMFDHLKQAARNFFGHILKPAGLDCYCRVVHRLEKSITELRSELACLEGQLVKTQESIRTRLGDVTCPDVMVCILESSWTTQSRATHGLY